MHISSETCNSGQFCRICRTKSTHTYRFSARLSWHTFRLKSRRVHSIIHQQGNVMTIDLVIKQSPNGKFDAKCFDGRQKDGVVVKGGDFEQMIDLYRMVSAVVPGAPVRVRLQASR